MVITFTTRPTLGYGMDGRKDALEEAGGAEQHFNITEVALNELKHWWRYVK